MSPHPRGLEVAIHPGARRGSPLPALEIDIGSELPVAFSGMRLLIRALEEQTPATVASARSASPPEWNRLFPESAIGGRSLFDLADAPNQRRLFRESEQTYRVLNFCGHLITDGLQALGRPLVLRNAGACDLVSLRGLMHAVELSRLENVSGHIDLCEWSARHRFAPTRFERTRVAHLDHIQQRMRATGDAAAGPARPVSCSSPADPGLEAIYLARVVDDRNSRAQRLAAALLAIRACFFSTNYEGATLAAEIGFELLATQDHTIDSTEFLRAWDAQDHPHFDIPMIELDRSRLENVVDLRPQIHLHLAVVQAFTGQTADSLDEMGRGLACTGTSPETTADLRMYRALALTKRLGSVTEARQEIEAGLGVLAEIDRSRSGVHEAWLRNLYALTYFHEKDLQSARHQEELALSCIDGVPGPSATHLKTNLISNFSVLAEFSGDPRAAIRIWRTFEPLNRRLGSDNADKVHAYRLGTLLHLAEDDDAAAASFEMAFAKAEASGDVFNAVTIAAALARLLMSRGDRVAAEGAGAWFARAATKARAAGDCLQMAKALAGLSIASGSSDLSDAREALRCNSTHALAGVPFAQALTSDDQRAVLDALPLPRGKMVRPFDLVNV